MACGIELKLLSLANDDEAAFDWSVKQQWAPTKCKCPQIQFPFFHTTSLQCIRLKTTFKHVSR